MSRSPGNPVALTVNLRSWEGFFQKIFFSYVQPRNKILLFALFFFIGLRNLLSEPPSLKQVYRLQYSKSHCGVTVDFIVVRIISFFTICHPVLMSEMKLKLPRQNHEFQKFSETISSFCLWQSFKPQQKPKPECVKKMSCEPQMVTIYISYDNNWLSYGKCKIWLKSFSPGNVVEDVISMWHISLLRVITVPCHQETQY